MEEEEDAPKAQIGAATALLVTEVRLRDDGLVYNGTTRGNVDADDTFMHQETIPNGDLEDNGSTLTEEEVELLSQMVSLGLPSSFGTSSEVVEVKGGKSGKKPSKLKYIQERAQSEWKGSVQDLNFKVEESEMMEINNEGFTLVHQIKESRTAPEVFGVSNDANVGTDSPQNAEQPPLQVAGSIRETCSTWMPAWDDYYQRHYFYNIETWETTWDAPEGFDDVNGPDNLKVDPSEERLLERTEQISEQLTEQLTEHITEQFSSVQVVCSDQAEPQSLGGLPVPCGSHIIFEDESNEENEAMEFEIPEIETASDEELVIVRSKKRRRLKKQLRNAALNDTVVLPEGISATVLKYWYQRYSLFSNFDKGIQMDEEGWFSVTPEVIAKHHAVRCASPVVIDAFAGVGGNTIQFALRSGHVIAIDKDPLKVVYAKHNAEIYGVSDRIEFIVGDFFQLAPSLKADVVFLSPPWGGPEYCKAPSYDIETMLQPKDGFTLFKAAQAIAPNIALYLPRNVDLEQIAHLSWLSNPPLNCEVEKNFVNDKLKAITVYYGDFADPEPSES